MPNIANIVLSLCVTFGISCVDAAPSLNVKEQETLKKIQAFVVDHQSNFPVTDLDLRLNSDLGRQDEDVEFEVLNSSGVQVGLGNFSRKENRIKYLHFWPLFPNTDKTLSQEDLRRITREFVKGTFPQVLSPDNTTLKCSDMDDKGLYDFTWSLAEQGICKMDVEVKVQAWDGKVNEVSVYEAELPSPILPSPDPKRIQALIQAAVTNKYQNQRVNIIEYSASRKASHEARPRYYWDANLIASVQGKKTAIYVSWNEAKNEIISIEKSPYRPPTSSAMPMLSIERWPTWSQDDSRIAFASNRQWQGFPSYATNPDSLYVVNAAKPQEFSALRPVAESGWPNIGYTAPAFSPISNVLLCSVDEQVVQIDLEAGTLLTHTTKSRPGGIASWSHDGKRICFSAERSIGDQDIFVADDENSLRSSKGQWRVALLEGEDKLPVFSPDDKQIAFAHRESTQQGPPNWAIYTVKPDKIYTQNEPAQKIVGGLGDVGRMTWFPDGERLLIWEAGTKNIKVVNVKTRAVTPFTLPALRDPSMPGSLPLSVADPILSHSGKQIAFAGYLATSKNDTKAAWHIYICNLDGSGLKCLTPNSQVKGALYTFPKTGKTTAKLGYATGQAPARLPFGGGTEQQKDELLKQ